MAWDFALPGTTERPQEREQREQREFQRRLQVEATQARQFARQRIQERAQPLFDMQRRRQQEATSARQLAQNHIRQRFEEREQERVAAREMARKRILEVTSRFSGGPTEEERVQRAPAWAQQEAASRILLQGGQLPEHEQALRQAPRFAREALGIEAASIPGHQFQSILPEQAHDIVGRVPLVGSELERLERGLTSPIGIAATLGTGAVAPMATAAGLGGTFAGGLAGQALEEAGVPVVQTPIGNIGPRSVGEVLGGLYTGPRRAIRPGQVPDEGIGPALQSRLDDARVRGVRESFAPAQAVDARAALMEENRTLKTLIQEGRATPAQEARMVQVRNELADLTSNVELPSGTRISSMADEAQLPSRASYERYKATGSTDDWNEYIREWGNPPWREGDTVETVGSEFIPGGQQGTVRYVYPNGFTLIDIPGQPTTGGVLNNNTTFANADLRPIRGGTTSIRPTEIQPRQPTLSNLADEGVSQPSNFAEKPFTPEELRMAREAGNETMEGMADWIRNRRGGFVPGRGVSETSNVPARTWRDDLSEGIARARENIEQNRPLVTQEKGIRIGNYEEEFQRLLRQGVPREDAQRMASTALRGELPKAEAVTLDLTDDTRNQIWQAIDEFDFGRGVGADYERFRTRSALMKMASGERLPENELSSLAKVIGEDNATAIREIQKRTRELGIGEKALELAIIPKAVLSSFDVSYPLRQGMMLGPRHPKEFLSNIPRAIRAWGSEDYARSVQRSILDDTTPIKLADGSEIPFAQWADEDGLIRSLDTGLSESEEVFRSSMAERIPIIGKAVRASNRSFVTYGNKLRADVARNMLKVWQKSGRNPTREELSALSDMLNRFSGRGTLVPKTLQRTDLGKRFTDMMQGALWAPQYRVAGPEAIGQMFNYKNPRIAREAFQNFMTYFGAGAGLLAMAKASGLADVQLDPRSTDFGKVKIGNTRFNFWGTNQLLARSIAQIITDERFDPNLGVVPLTDRSDVFWRYLRSGLAPEWSAAVDWINGQTYIGEPSGIPTTPEQGLREVKERLLPLIVQDIYDAVKEGDPVTAAVIAPLATLGGSFQTYEPSASQQLGAIPEFKGLTPREVYDFKQFYDTVDEEMAGWRRQGRDDITAEQAIRYIAEAQGKEPNFVEWAVLLRPGSKSRAELRNPEWVDFVARHEKELTEAGREYLYDRNYIIDAIRELETTASSKQ